MLGAKYCEEMINCPREAQEQVPASYKQSKINEKLEESFIWLTFDENFQGAFSKVCRRRVISLQGTGGALTIKPFKNWKKAIKKMKTHAMSDIHIQLCEAEVAVARALKEGSIVQRLQRIGNQEKLKNRMAIIALIHCTQFLTRHHIPLTTNFDEL